MNIDAVRSRHMIPPAPPPSPKEDAQGEAHVGRDDPVLATFYTSIAGHHRATLTPPPRPFRRLLRPETL